MTELTKIPGVLLEFTLALSGCLIAGAQGQKPQSSEAGILLLALRAA